MPDVIKCKDCKYFEMWRTPERAAQFGQVYECGKYVISSPSPDDYCSKAERKEEQKFMECDDVISRQAVNTLVDELARAINMLDLPSVTQKSGKWIPVSEERLPKENEVVIASTKYGVYPEARYIKEYGWEWAYEAGADYWKELEGVTAWMPLPKAYDPQESEDKEDAE